MHKLMNWRAERETKYRQKDKTCERVEIDNTQVKYTTKSEPKWE